MTMLRGIHVRGGVVLVVMALTLFVSHSVRHNISDLRSYSEYKNVKKIAEVNSYGQKESFNVGDICEPLKRMQRVLIVNISGYLEVSNDDIEILSLTNSLNGIRIVINEARQPIIYLTDPNSAPNIKGYELLPPVFDLYEGKKQEPDSFGKLDFTVRLFQMVSNSSAKLVIQSATRTPIEYSQAELGPIMSAKTSWCDSIGTLGYEGRRNSSKVTFSWAEIDEENLGVLRNLQARVVVFALSVCSTVLVVGWLRQKRTPK
jgi:hypothetical protein